MSQASYKERARQAVSSKGNNSPPAKTPSSKIADGNEADRRPKPKPPAAGKVPAYYDCMSGAFYMLASGGEYQRFPEKAIGYELRREGFYRDVFHDNSLSYLEAEILRIIKEQSVHFAGQLGGFSPGVYEMCGSRVLVTRGPEYIKPEPGSWNTLKDFFTQLLGEQARYLYAWIKWALDSLRRGLPWSPGQMLAIAGPPNSGKSFLQSLITPILGGRVSSPYRYMTEGTNFNAEIFGAEHALIGDQNHAIDSRSRRNFGAAIKDLVVNKEQRVEGKNKAAATLLPFLRLSISLNDNPEALLVLPPLDSDVRDKILLLHATPVKFPWPSKKYPDSQAYNRQLLGELPAFLAALRRWRIPETIACKRYGVVSYLNPLLVEEVEKLSPERKLWDAIESNIFLDDYVQFWEGSAADLERQLEKLMKPLAVQRIFPFSTACGVYLAKLAKMWPVRVQFRDVGKNKRIYTIHREACEE